MDFVVVKNKTEAFSVRASLISEIRHAADYENALILMEELLESYDEYRILIGQLADTIERWENTAPEFSEFNQRITQFNDEIALQRTLTDQYRLKIEKLESTL